MPGLDEHRHLVERGFAEAGMAWDQWPGGVLTGRFDNEFRMSALLLLSGYQAPHPSHDSPQLW